MPALPENAQVDVLKAFVQQALSQQGEQFKETLLELAKARDPYSFKNDIPNPNIPPERYIEKGKALYIPMNMAIVTPYMRDGQMRPHPHNRKMEVFVFSHDKPVSKNGQPDKVPFCKLLVYDTAIEKWVKESHYGPSVFDRDDDPMITDMAMLHTTMRYFNHYNSMPTGRVYEEAKRLGVPRSDNVDAMRTMLANAEAQKYIRRTTQRFHDQALESKKGEMMEMAG